MNEREFADNRDIGQGNSLRAISHRPDAMRDVARLYETVMSPGSVSVRLKELLYVAVSAANDCDYCEALHIAGARKAGISPQEIEHVRAEIDYHFTTPERAALRYARELTRTAETEAETREALDIMFGPDQRVEMTLVIALANFTNRFNNGLSAPLEKERHWAGHHTA